MDPRVDEKTKSKIEPSSEVSSEVNIEVKSDPSSEIKREQKLQQLKNARQSKKRKKDQESETLSYLKDRVDTLTELLIKTNQEVENKNTVSESSDHEPSNSHNKRQRVTRDPRPDVDETLDDKTDHHGHADESWSTSLIRTSAILTLGGLSYYMQNHYGKKNTLSPTQKKKASETSKKKTVLLRNEIPIRNSASMVGRSGFSSNKT